MADPADTSHINSLKDVWENANWLTNWMTSIAFAGLLSLAASTVKDKLTFAAILISFFVAALLDAVLWPLMLIYISGGLAATIILAMVCGLGGLVLLLLLIGFIRNYIKEDGKKILETAVRKTATEGNADA